MVLPSGFLVSGIHSGIKTKNLDLGLVYCKEGCLCSGFFTRNSNVSYSVILSRKNINNEIKVLIANSGNANCFSDNKGVVNTKKVCDRLAAKMKIKKNSVLIASTGIIGKCLPYKKIINSFSGLIKGLGDCPENFARSILTSDTFMKVLSRKVKVSGGEIKIMGFAKGAGMIKPGMATMLAFILTDAKIDKKKLNTISREAIKESFNSITIDGCTSTNDSVYIMTSGKSFSLVKGADLDKFRSALKDVSLELAKMIVKDAEGATKFIKLTVSGALTINEAQRAAFAVSDSLLFKTAMYGNNPNWGRIIAALGQAKIKVDEDKIKVRATSLKKKEVAVNVCLGRGKFSKTVYTCDLTPDYVRINADYS